MPFKYVDVKSRLPDFVWFYRLSDFLIPAGVFYAILMILALPVSLAYIWLGIFGSVLFLIHAQLFGVYRAWKGYELALSGQLILKAWFFAWTGVIVTAFLLKESHEFSRLAILVWALVTPVSLMAYRLVIRLTLMGLSQQRHNLRNVAIIGVGGMGLALAKRINRKPWLGYKVVAFYDDNATLQESFIEQIPVRGTIEKLQSDIEQSSIHEVYICLPLQEETKIKQLLDVLNNSTVVVKFVPDLFAFDLMHARWVDIDGIPIISVFDTPLNSLSSRIVKRTEDVLLASFFLLLSSPLLVIIAIAIKVSSSGPVIFKQTRYGLNGQRINVYKFRSMACMENTGNIQQARVNDPRITPLGRFLRKTSLDELPQFVNVLQGKMSIVGPRPHAVAHNEEYRKLVPQYMQRHVVKPGITGWAQVNGWRGETDTLDKMQKRVEYDLHYIKNWSLWFDIKIIIMTFYKGFVHHNAR